MTAEAAAAPLSGRALLARAGRTGAAIAKVYLGYKGLELLERGGLPRLAYAARRRWDDSSARTLHRAAERLGGLLLKAGQFAGSRPDLVPESIAKRLSLLQDRVAPQPFSVVRSVLHAELGPDLDRHFAKLWRRPLASASLAQVHRALLHDGRDVVVKVQRPEVANQVQADLRNMRVAAAALERLEGTLGLGELVRQLDELIPQELDFRREGRAAEELRGRLAAHPRIRIPRVVPELCTGRVLVTEYLAGVKVTDRPRLLRAGIEPVRVVSGLVEAYVAQVLQQGFFHADPHPGNLLALNESGETSIAFLDFGLVAQFSPASRAALLGLGRPLLAGEAAGVGRALAALGATADDPAVLERAGALLVEFVRRRRGDAVPRAAGRELAHGLGELARGGSRLRLPSELWLLGRVVGLIYGIASTLGVAVDPFSALVRASPP